MMDGTTDERLNDIREWQDVTHPTSVQVSPTVLRRLHRLHARAEFVADLAQQTNAQFQEAMLAIFEDAGLQANQQDGFSIDWRTSTVSLRRQGEGA